MARLGHSDGGVDPRLAGVVVRHFAVVQLSVTLVELKRVLVALLLAMRLAANAVALLRVAVVVAAVCDHKGLATPANVGVRATKLARDRVGQLLLAAAGRSWRSNELGLCTLRDLVPDACP